MANSIELWRTGWVISHNGNSGEVSELWVGDLKTPDSRLMFWALEALMINGKRMMRLDLGQYKVKMEYSPGFKQYCPNDTSGQRRQFRVYGHNKKAGGGVAPILIHYANYPEELEGCIAPGMKLKSNFDGVDDSCKAMDKIFTAFGGFREGTEVDLLISKNDDPD